jgi:hypothetical protein
MDECPFCKELESVKGLPDGEETTCHFCGRPIPSTVSSQQVKAVLTKPVQTAAIAELSRPKDKSGSRIPIPKKATRQTVSAGEERAAGSVLGSLGRIDVGTALALLCGGLAICLASVSPLSFLTKPLAVLGLVVGLSTGFVSTLRKGRNAVMPAGACLLCLVVVLFVGSWTRGGAAVPPERGVMSLGDRKITAVRDDDWPDASSNAYWLHEVVLQITSARLENVELSGQGGAKTTPDKYLVLRLRMNHGGMVFKKFDYEPWRNGAKGLSKNPPVLMDSNGQSYSQVQFPVGWNVKGRRQDMNYLNTGRPLNEVLVFPAPASKIEYLRLQLPAVAFALTLIDAEGKQHNIPIGDGDFKLQIPWSMVEGNQGS